MRISPHQDLKSLVGKLSQELIAAQKKGDHDLLQAIPVISPSMSFSDWVQVEIAETAGLCMGFKFLMSGEFLERFFALIGDSAKENPWSKNALTWQILSFIKNYTGILGIQNPTSRDELALAGLIADQFDQYAHYRPDLIERWNQNSRTDRTSEDEEWQMELWRNVKAEIGEPPSVVSLKELEEKALFQNIGIPPFSATIGSDILSDPLSNPLKIAFPILFVVGTGTLDPLLVRILRILEKAGCEIHIDLSLPSLGYLDDLKRSGAKIEEEEDPESISMSDGHSLLVSMGRKAIGTFRLLGELDEQYTGWPETETAKKPIEGLSVLNRIQTDIRNLNESGSKWVTNDRDLSLRVHSCFGARREMEVLRDELLRAFCEIPELKPHEVLIVTPSLTTYAPLVSAVLEQVLDGGNESRRLEDRWPKHSGSLSSDKHLSIRLTELPPNEQSPVAEGILALLKIVHHDGFEASALIELLHLRAVRSSLGITDDAEALDKLRDWVIQSGLTRDLGENSAQSEPGSWQFVSDRLVAGSWFGPEETFLYPEIETEGSGLSSLPKRIFPASDTLRFILSIADELGGHRKLRERFLEWLGDLSSILNHWKVKAPPVKWSQRLTEATLKLLIPKSDEEVHLDIQKQLTFLANQTCAVPVESGAMLDWLEAEFEQSGKRSIMTGQIALGGFIHLQHIPCRVLAMVGMQDGQFPRQNRVPSWSLLRLKPKIWDRNARIEDRQLFLDAVLTPTERLIITASSRNIRSGKSEPFSVCVDELLRATEKVGVLKEQTVVEHPLQPFSSSYFDGTSKLPPSYDLQSKEVAVALVESSKIEQTVISRNRIPFWVAEADQRTDLEMTEIMLDDLIAFWKDPAKGYIKALGIQTYEDDQNDEVLDWTPLQLDKLQEWKVKEVVMNGVLEGNCLPDFTRAKLLANRGLPPQILGDEVWSRLKQTAESIGNKVLEIAGVSELQPPPDSDAQNIDLTHNLSASSRGGFAIPAIEVAIDVPYDDGKSTILVRGEIRTGVHLGEKVLLGYRLNEIKEAKHYLEPWIRGVAVAATGAVWPTCLIAEKQVEKPLLIAAMNAAEAKTILGFLVQGFLEGQLRPLCYAPQTTDRYVREAIKVEEKEIPPRLSEMSEVVKTAMDVAAKEWSQDSFSHSPGGEGTTRTSKLAWRDQDPTAGRFCREWHEWACKIGEPMRLWFTSQNGV